MFYEAVFQDALISLLNGLPNVENLTSRIAWTELIKVNPPYMSLEALCFNLSEKFSSMTFYVLYFIFYISEAMVVGQPIEVFPS
jgi:hypothetical protein